MRGGPLLFSMLPLCASVYADGPPLRDGPSGTLLQTMQEALPGSYTYFSRRGWPGQLTTSGYPFSMETV